MGSLLGGSQRHTTTHPAQLAKRTECAELSTLERWLDQAITAATVDDALA